jgi:hypothetical protein
MLYLDKNYNKYVDRVNEFRVKLSWEQIAMEHAQLYYKVLSSKKEHTVIA